jgi:hypothetical protein
MQRETGDGRQEWRLSSGPIIPPTMATRRWIAKRGKNAVGRRRKGGMGPVGKEGGREGPREGWLPPSCGVRRGGPPCFEQEIFERKGRFDGGEVERGWGGDGVMERK